MWSLAPVARADTTALATHPQWGRLIHVTNGGMGHRSDILESGFYLTADRHPAAELHATLAALRNPDRALRQAALCRYPARASWLAAELDEPALAQSLTQCTALQGWLGEAGAQRLIVAHVSGYFGNPASAFGHLLLRVTTREGAPTRGLLDKGINFGARIPPQDSALAYIARGLTGGYAAQFSEQPHHLQDHVYTAAEARDMWAYELALPPAALQLLLLHLWELRDIDFNYYFLRKNCAWRVAELLAIALEQPVGPTHQPYFLPDDVFFALEALNERTPGLIATRHFIPSLAHRAASRLARLPASDRNTVKQYLTHTADTDLSHLSTDALDYLLDLLDHRLARTPTAEQAALIAQKRPILRARLTRDSTVTPTPALPPPALGLPPRAVSLSHHSGNAVTLSLAAYDHELINRNRAQLANGALKAAVLQLSRADGDTQLDRFDIIGTTRLGSPVGRVADDQSETAWRIGASLSRYRGGPLSALLNGAVGRSVTGRHASAYLMLDTAVWTRPERADLRLEAGVIYRAPDRPWALQLTAQSRSASNREAAPWHAEAALRWQWNRHAAITASTTRQSTTSSHAVGLQWRW